MVVLFSDNPGAAAPEKDDVMTNEEKQALVERTGVVVMTTLGLVGGLAAAAVAIFQVAKAVKHDVQVSARYKAQDDLRQERAAAEEAAEERAEARERAEREAAQLAATIEAAIENAFAARKQRQ